MSVAHKFVPRVHPRVPAVLRVRYDDPADLLDYTENMSASGLFIATEHAFAEGDEIAFELSFPGLVKPLRLNAQVIWRRARQQISDPLPPGIGVRLLFTSDLERVWLRRLVGRFAVDAARPSRGSERVLPTILIVEANPNTRALFADALRTRLLEGDDQPRVLEVEDAESAVNIISEQRVDLVLIESRACAGRDVALLSAIRTGGRIPVVVVAGAEEQLSEPVTSLADVCLRRPVPAKALLYTAKMLVATPED